jgi:hypothetical protein
MKLSLTLRRMLAVPLTAAALLGAAVSPASASAPLHTAWARMIECRHSTYGQDVAAYLPRMTSISGGLENVYWRPVLYRYKPATKTWGFYGLSFPTYYAAADSGGIVYNQWVTSGGMQVTFARFSGLPAGYYAVRNTFTWQDGSHAASWSEAVSGGYWCAL